MLKYLTKYIMFGFRKNAIGTRKKVANVLDNHKIYYMENK
jgi:hypothetical protein